MKFNDGMKKKFSRGLLLFMFVLSTFLPLYMADGYYNLGEAKAKIYGYIVFGGMVLTVPFLIIFAIKYVSGRKAAGDGVIKLDMTSLSAILILIEAIISFCLSSYKETALWGLEGWRNGLAALASYIFLFLIFRFFAEEQYKALIVCIPALFSITLVAVLNRFGIMNIVSEGEGRQFISTTGNVNWFCGYLSVFAVIPVGILIMRKLYGYLRWLLYVVIFVTALSIYAQGGSSIFLSILAVLPFLVLMSFGSRYAFDRLMDIVILNGAAMETICILMKFFGERYTYDAANIGIWLSEAHIGLILIAAGVYVRLQTALLRLIRQKRYEASRDFTDKDRHDLADDTVKDTNPEVLIRDKHVFLKKIWAFMPYAVIISLIAVVTIQLSGLIPDSFGNNRGSIWRITSRLYSEMPVMNKIFGAGPDCYYEVSASIPEITGAIQAEFGADRLTNAHSGLLSVLVNEGLAGLICRLLMYFLVMKQLICSLNLDGAEDKEVTYTTFLIMVSYFAAESVMFEQPLATPFLFIFMGNGVKRKKEKFL